MTNVIFSIFMLALINVESGGDCFKVGQHGDVGCLQVRQPVISDVNNIYGTNYTITDMQDRRFAIDVAIKYLNYWGQRYEQKTGNPVTNEVLARIWNGGPNGWEKHCTISFWKKVQQELEKLGG